ncbi:hypothetical protein MNV49_000438 [Pseudohyphozyma bogoriensis]|nr:hypothetical protein MNV49_000438 [Pseudohyphozyma bogoriensis]
MPTDLRREPPRRRQPQSTFQLPIKLRYIILLAVLVSFYSSYALHHNLPPWNWIDSYVHRNDKVVQSRPGFKKVPRYSPEHRYRPAASPVIKTTKNGKVKHHGDYHLKHGHHH